MFAERTALLAAGVVAAAALTAQPFFFRWCFLDASMIGAKRYEVSFQLAAHLVLSLLAV